MVTAANKNGILYALYQSNLTLAWDQRICGCGDGQDEHISTAWGGGYVYAISSITTVGGVVYNSSVFAFNPLTGAIVWERGFTQSSFYGYAAPLWVNQLLIVADQGTLIVFNATTGTILYQDTVAGVIQAAPSISRGEVFAGTTTGHLLAFDLSLGSTATQSVTSGPTPVLDSFNVTGSGGLPPYHYAWTFGDGTTSNSQSPSHTYTSSGTYDVMASVTDLAGQVATYNLTVGVGVGYNVTFKESGLRAATTWSVSLDGIQHASTTSTLVVAVPDGSYLYRLGSVTGYSGSPSSGLVTVTGANQTISIAFRSLYSATFSESGLATGIVWTVTVDGIPMSLTTDGGMDSLTFQEANGTHAYTIADIPAWNETSISESGNLVVSGTPVVERLTYVLVASPVTFSESGLGPDLTWWVTFNGVSKLLSTDGGTDTFSFASEPNGTYTYSIAEIPGYSQRTIPYSGSETVNGTTLDVSVTYTILTPAITVSPKQGPVGATVEVSGTSFSGTSTVGLVFDSVTIMICTSGSLKTGTSGRFSCTFSVPSGTSGTTVKVTDVGGQTATGKFAVTIPAITVSPTQGPVGATVTVSGVRFSVSSTVGLVFDGVVITSCPGGGSLTAAVGAASFSCAFPVRSGTSGTSVVATDVGGQTATGTFKVTTAAITVNPKQGPVGATITVSGTGFSVSRTVELVFDDVVISSCSGGSLASGAAGTFGCTSTVPSGTSGTTVKVTDVGGQTATGSFAVTIPAITVSPKQGPVGATVTVSGVRFSVSSTVGLVFDGITITSCSGGGSLTAAVGAASFSCTFTVPSGTSGTTVKVTDVGGQTATGSFAVTIPAITVSPKQGPVGATVTVSGVRFSVSSTVGLVFDGITITSCSGGGSLTAAVGAASFSCTFTVPSGTSGTTVKVTDVGGQIALGKFTVT